MNKVDRIKVQVHTKFVVEACRLLREDKKVIQLFEDIDQHFELDKNNYALSYEMMLSMLEPGTLQTVFNIMLDIKGYDIVYNKTLHNLGVRPK